MRIALGIEYDGSEFCGWQIQSQSPSIQACVEKALGNIANHPVRVHCAGRTDTAVHALNQVIHFDTETFRECRAWVNGCNANLPKAISVLWAKQVPELFHARFSAHKRTYRYVIFNRHIRPTFLAKRVVWDYRRLDVQKMRDAAQYLIGENDYNAYRAAGCQAKSPIRTIYRIDIKRNNDIILLDVKANAFLHHMVRNIAGVLMSIGAGEQPVHWSQQVLESKDRSQGGITAAPHGLYLVDIEYPKEFNLPTATPTSMLW